MVVEVDLWNRTKEEFDKKKNDPKFRAGLKKGISAKKDPSPNPDANLPIMPEFKGAVSQDGKLFSGQQLQLLPGMFGQMTLVLRHFEKAYMLPSSAIVALGGFAYIYVVQDGKAHIQPVEVQIDDGKLAKVELLNSRVRSSAI